MKTSKFKPSEKSLRLTLEQQSHSYTYDKMMDFIIHQLKSIDGVVWTKDVHDNFYAQKGSTNAQEYYPCVVAHYDTVHKIREDKTIHKSNGYFYAFDHTTLEQCGTGGDDLVGVWTVFEMLKHRDVIKVALFAQEEIGCVGSGKANMEFFKDVGFALQTDRKGKGDFVNTIGGVELSSDEWIEHIKPILEKHKYEVTSGGLTDVKSLVTKGIGVCTANMSSGYYRPHTDTEVVCIKDAKNVCRMINNIIEHCGLKRWEHKYEKPSYETYNYNSGWYNTYNNYGYHRNYNSYGTVTRNVNSNSWQRKPRTVTKTDRKIQKLSDYVEKGWWQLNIHQMKSFLDTLKFVVKAKNQHALDILDDICRKLNLDPVIQLDLLCQRTLSGDDETAECSTVFMSADLVEPKHWVTVCAGCGDALNLLDHFKSGIDLAKSDKNQLTIDDVINDTDKTAL